LLAIEVFLVETWISQQVGQQVESFRQTSVRNL
jgi:hypothetical protein